MKLLYYTASDYPPLFPILSVLTAVTFQAERDLSQFCFHETFEMELPETKHGPSTFRAGALSLSYNHPPKYQRIHGAFYVLGMGPEGKEL